MSEKSSDDVRVRVVAAIAMELGCPAEDVTEDKNFADDLGADSLDAIEVVMGLEEEFGIEIPDEEGETWKTVGQAIEGVEKLMKGISGP